MIKKALVAGVLITTSALAGSARAVGLNNNDASGKGNQVQQQTQTANMGEGGKTQTQNNEQTQGGVVVPVVTGVQAQVQNPGGGSQTRNQEQAMEQVQEQPELAAGAQKKSGVANAVQAMLQIAERNDGIGKQIRTIAQDQNHNQEKLEASVRKAQSRNGLVKFFIGADYGEINDAKKILEQNRQQIQQLNEIKNQLVNQGESQNLAEQIKILEQMDLQKETELNAAQKGFSMLGWMFKWFSK